MQKVYQRLYQQSDYGNAKVGLCPGVRYLPLYQDYLTPVVLDLGCGSGDTVHAIRELGIPADGLDWVALNNDMMVRDITLPIESFGYKTAICIDVLEHIPEKFVNNVLLNLAQCPTQIVTTHSASSQFNDDIELHVTQWPKSRWIENFSKHFKICKTITLQENVRYLYIMATR